MLGWRFVEAAECSVCDDEDLSRKDDNHTHPRSITPLLLCGPPSTAGFLRHHGNVLPGHYQDIRESHLKYHPLSTL